MANPELALRAIILANNIKDATSLDVLNPHSHLFDGILEVASNAVYGGILFGSAGALVARYVLKMGTETEFLTPEGTKLAKRSAVAGSIIVGSLKIITQAASK